MADVVKHRGKWSEDTQSYFTSVKKVQVAMIDTRVEICVESSDTELTSV